MKTTQTKPVHHLAKYQLFKRLLKLGASDIVAIANEVGITETQANKWLSPPAKQKAKQINVSAEIKKIEITPVLEFLKIANIDPFNVDAISQIMHRFALVQISYISPKHTKAVIKFATKNNMPLLGNCKHFYNFRKRFEQNGMSELLGRYGNQNSRKHPKKSVCAPNVITGAKV